MQPSADVIGHIAASFGIAVDGSATLTLAARGAMGRIWRLDPGVGPTRAVKELLWPTDERSVRYEIAFRDAAVARGLRDAPANHRTVNGTYLCAVPTAAGSATVRLFDWAPGQPMTTPDVETASWVGRTLALLHRLAHPAGDVVPDPWYWRCPGEREWDELLASAADASWFEALSAARPGLVELTAGVRPDADPPWVWCHRDLQPSNVLVHSNGPDRRFTLLDWENAGPASPDRELAAVLLAWSVDDDTTRTMLAEYRRAGGPVPGLDEASLSMAAAMQVNYVYVQARAALDPNRRPADRKFATDQCTAALAGLVTPHRLAALHALANAGLAGG